VIFDEWPEIKLVQPQDPWVPIEKVLGWAEKYIFTKDELRPQGLALSRMYVTVKSEADLLEAQNVPFKWNPEFLALLTPIEGSEYKSTLIFKEWEAKEVCYYTTKKGDVPISY